MATALIAIYYLSPYWKELALVILVVAGAYYLYVTSIERKWQRIADQTRAARDAEVSEVNRRLTVVISSA
jgi:uncharacterized membrane protein